MILSLDPGARRGILDAVDALRDDPATGPTDGHVFAPYQGMPVACFGPDAVDIHGIDGNVGLDGRHGITRTMAPTMAGRCGVGRLAA